MSRDCPCSTLLPNRQFPVPLPEDPDTQITAQRCSLRSLRAEGDSRASPRCGARLVLTAAAHNFRQRKKKILGEGVDSNLGQFGIAVLRI